MTAPIEIGETLAGKYEIERHLAKGGMGMVVVARHLQLDRQVAIKFMLPHLLAAGVEPDALERFVREGRAAVKLRGENVARVIDVDTLPDGTPYMVMEYLEGQDLSHHVQKHGPLPLAESVDYVLQACVAMAEAHLCGIIHRDLKPSNLFVTRRPDGSALIKVLDFGISKLYEDAGGDATQTAVMMGSPSYMAPEQAQSARTADVRSDIWSLGVILYECTSKKLPYGKQASTAGIVAQLIYEQPRPLAEVAPNLPAAFCQVVDTCLNKAPVGRYQTIGELASALLPFASAVGRQAAASIHAIIGGASASSAPPVQAGIDQVQVAAVAPAAHDGSLRLDDTELAPEPPVMTLSLARPEEAGAEADDAAKAKNRAAALALDLDAIARGGRYGPRHVWPRVQRAVGLAISALLAALTALVLISDSGDTWPASWIGHLDAWLHQLGYEIAGWAGRYRQILVGPVLQIAIPFVLARVLGIMGRRKAAALAWWWLGDNLVHIARVMAAASWQRSTPITGDLNPWNHWFATWGILAQVGSIAGAVFWAGALLMMYAVLLFFWRTVGPSRAESFFSGRRR